MLFVVVFQFLSYNKEQNSRVRQQHNIQMKLVQLQKHVKYFYEKYQQIYKLKVFPSLFQAILIQQSMIFLISRLIIFKSQKLGFDQHNKLFNIEMESLKILQNIRNKVLTSEDIKNFKKTVGNILEKYDSDQVDQFARSVHSSLVAKELQKLDIPGLFQLTSKLPKIDKIIALSVIRHKKFSLLYVLVPKGCQFNWHSHPKMVGNTRCITGNLKITSLDQNYLVQDHNQKGVYNYLKEHLRTENLSPNGKKVSSIDPNHFNFHRIQAEQQSCFFDLLMPDYPDNECNFFDTIKEQEDFITVKQIDTPLQQIVDFNILLHGKPIRGYSSLFQTQN